jgi:hypothetical protein
MSKPELKEFDYTKASGETSFRRAIILRPPQKNYLALDVTDLSLAEVSGILEAITALNEDRDEIFEDYSNRWRSFKPENIDWHIPNE